MPDVIHWYSNLLVTDSCTLLRSARSQVQKSREGLASAKLRLQEAEGRVERSRQTIRESDYFLERLEVFYGRSGSPKNDRFKTADAISPGEPL
jgi:hypothetical protein